MKIDPTKIVAFLTALVTLAGGSYALGDKLGWFKRDILRWAPEEFSITNGSVSGKFDVTVARQKLRDDCDVLEFRLEVRDSKLHVHPVTPDIAVFAGPVGNKVDKFAYSFSFSKDHQNMIATGKAVLLGRIKYKCPEGETLVQYPRHANMQFEITK